MNPTKTYMAQVAATALTNAPTLVSKNHWLAKKLARKPKCELEGHYERAIAALDSVGRDYRFLGI